MQYTTTLSKYAIIMIYSEINNVYQKGNLCCYHIYNVCKHGITIFGTIPEVYIYIYIYIYIYTFCKLIKHVQYYMLAMQF